MCLSLAPQISRLTETLAPRRLLHESIFGFPDKTAAARLKRARMTMTTAKFPETMTQAAAARPRRAHESRAHDDDDERVQ